MEFKKTEYPDFPRACLARFGAQQGETLCRDAGELLSQLAAQADWKGDRAVKKHMLRCILPLSAVYLTCLRHSVPQPDAYAFALELAQTGARKRRRKNALVGALPFGYALFSRFCRRVMTADYPPAGWDLTWVRYDRGEVHFDITRCVYADTTRALGCPELCPVFCANDDTTLAGFAPAVRFERAGTLARGQERCDFHFVNARARTD